MSDSASAARYRVARSVAWVDSVEGQAAADAASAGPADRLPEAWIAKLPDGQPLSLNGSGLDIWLACVEPVSAEPASAGAAGSVPAGIDASGATAAEITDRVRIALGSGEVPVGDVAAFLEQLAGLGLVDRLGDGGAPV